MKGRKICGIYKITSPSGQIYIGQSNHIRKRFESYKKLDCVRQKGLYNSFLKYGVKAHVFEILEICNEQSLTQREIYWSDFYNSVKEGLNCIKPGGWSDRQATKLKMSENGKNQKVDYERLKKMQEMNKGRIGSLSQHAIAVFQYDLNGFWLKEWGSITEAAQYLGIKSSHISSVCKEKRRQAAGYAWRYANVNYEGQMIIVPHNIKSKNKRIAETDEHGNILKLYINAKDASLAVGIADYSIREYCRSKALIKSINKYFKYPTLYEVERFDKIKKELIP